MTKFYEYRQNNSGGSFDIDDAAGIGVIVWIEATDDRHADSRAESIGIYFNGVDDEMDCECCGDRWSEAWWRDGEDKPLIDFMWHDTIYVHYMDGTIERIKKEA
jgi:hypothetical protein